METKYYSKQVIYLTTFKVESVSSQRKSSSGFLKSGYFFSVVSETKAVGCEDWLYTTFHPSFFSATNFRLINVVMSTVGFRTHNRPIACALVQDGSLASWLTSLLV